MTFLHEQLSADPLTPEQQFEHDIAIVLQTALEHHHAGEFAEADILYQAILDAKPDHADANYNLGVTLIALGSCSEAIPYLETAQQIEPGSREVRDALKSAQHCGKGHGNGNGNGNGD